MIQLTICHPPQSPLILQRIDSLMSGLEFKMKLASVLAGGDSEDMRLVCGGRVIQDHLSLESQGVVEGSRIYVAITRKPVVSSVPASKPAREGPDPMMATLFKFLEDNPELYQQMLMNNPQMQKLIEKNPELRHALSDPSTLKSMLNAATNPKAYSEMLRGHDRAISNLENIPEGFSHLKKVYSTLQEPMYDAFTPKTKTHSASGVSDNVRITTTTTEPIPNPWAPRKTDTHGNNTVLSPFPTQSPIFGYKSRAHKRKHTSSMDDEMFTRGLNGLTGSVEAMGLHSPRPFAKELEAMHALGFEDDEGENLEALRAVDGDVEAAIEVILALRKSREGL